MRPRVNGYDVAKESKSVRRSIGIVFQMMCLDYEMTVFENLGISWQDILNAKRRKKKKDRRTH